jgi:hypothetical protein
MLGRALFAVAMGATVAVVRGAAGSSAVYEQAPWTTSEEHVSLDPDPVPGDGGLMGAIYTEAENFTITAAPGMPPPFNVTEWGRDHYYGATFENTFAHRKALLHSTSASVGKATSPPVAIPKANTYYVGVRYEAAYRFETEFTLTVRQGSATKFTKLYGQRASPKMWAFGYSARNHEIAGCPGDPTPECHWTWGATENWVRSCLQPACRGPLRHTPACILAADCCTALALAGWRWRCVFCA